MEHGPPSLWSFLPFIGLLLAIAIFPLVRRMAHFWERNRNKLLVALVLGFSTVLYYYFARGPAAAEHVLEHALLVEFVPFIVLLFSLYTIAGGIFLRGDLTATPAVNTAFLAAGSVLASFVGTTGASMLLIRPVLRTNRQRRRKVHTIVFFIFLVSNIGGCLTPLGDPPLFLGYLKGVPFWWTLRLTVPWLVASGILLAVYFLWDSWAVRRENPADLARDVSQSRPLGLDGGRNLIYLAAVVACVATVDPTKFLPGTEWLPPAYLREGMLLLLAALSWFTTPRNREIRAANEFNFAAIAEVACLFAGIFICMQAPVEYLKSEGAKLGIATPAGFFWAAGSLSSFLDNAPTYVVFFEAARAVAAGPGGAAPLLPPDPLLLAVSMGSVFMGANTYIGNGPNFMVKAIADKSGIRMPSFFGYMAYSVAILIPTFLALTWIFFRG